MTRLLLLLVLLFASGVATAQDAALRFVDSNPQESLTFAEMIRGMHGVVAMAEEEPMAIPVPLISALIVEGEVVETGASPFIAAPVQRIGCGYTAQEDCHFSGEYLERRASISLDKSVFAPAALVGFGSFVSPREEPTAEGGTSIYAVGTASVTAPVELASIGTGTGFGLGDARPALVRAIRDMAPEAYEAGESFLVFFVAPPRGGKTEAVVFLRKRPGR